ncbi:MAG TPA: FAD:protein FMN transferase, partial [Candidatus Limnocylindrales bacterium]
MVETAEWRAIGTGVRLAVIDGDLAAARSAVEAVLDEVDRTYSRFRADSELVALNAARGRQVRLSPLLAR